jgi:aminoglycoside 3-N-acetyltransferase
LTSASLAKAKLRAIHRRTRRTFVQWFLSYEADALERALRRVGVRSGDAVMLHSAFEPHHGFLGTSEDAVDAFLRAIGPEGHLLMVSMPYRSSSIDYLEKGRTFDVRRTPSAMGLVSEMFRRRPGVSRSLHPTHPVLACGPRVHEFLEGHEDCLYPCGPGSPFDRLLHANGKVVFFNVDVWHFTFFHWLEHRVATELGLPLYAEPPFEVPVVAADGSRRVVRTYVFSRAAIRRRRYEVLVDRLNADGVVRRTRVGATRVLALDLRDVTECVERMLREGVTFYDMDGFVSEDPTR